MSPHHLSSGLRGLLVSRNGTLSLIVFFVAAGLCFLHCIDGMSFAAVSSVVATIYTWTRARPSVLSFGPSTSYAPTAYPPGYPPGYTGSNPFGIKPP